MFKRYRPKALNRLNKELPKLDLDDISPEATRKGDRLALPLFLGLVFANSSIGRRGWRAVGQSQEHWTRVKQEVSLSLRFYFL